jgi:serine/threonine protein kinase/WD40 repeat protein/Tfp pilus assembly protein PilF
MSDSRSDLDAVGRVAEAFLARYRRGERPPLTEYTEQYPELAEQIRDLFPALVVMEELGSVGGPRTGASVGADPGKDRLPEQLGDYRVLREVGRGGMGVVYEAVQESLGRHVALKVLSAHGLLPPTHLERFRREARAAARLHHTNIVPVHGVGEHDGVHYYAMQFIQGQGLDEVLKEVKRLRSRKDPASAGSRPREPSGAGPARQAGPTHAPPVGPACRAGPGPARQAGPTSGSASGTELTSQPEAQYFRSVARMGMQVAAGLDYAHKQGILHRDIKPSNLLLDARGTVWITDFGLAKAEGTDELTHTGDIVGTLRYMAPEHLQSSSDPRSDVYGLGITLYELLTLRPAFEDSSRARLIERVRHDDPPPPRKVDRSIPRDLETIVLKAIAKEPGRRYQTAGEMGEDLGRFLAGEPVRARRVGVGERGVKWVRRRPAVAALLAVCAAAALCLVAGVLVHNARLGAALRDAQANLGKAERADREKTRQLAIARLREAQALRNSGQVGRRFESLEALKKAVEHFRALGQLDEERTLELRNEAIACLALADLKPGKAWTRDPGWSRPWCFDPTLRYYAVSSTSDDDAEGRDVRQGQLSVRRVADDREVVPLPGFGVRVAAARFSPDGRYLAADYEWPQSHHCVWDLRNRQAILKVSQVEYRTFSSFSPDSRLLALSRPDYSVRIYELPSGATWKELPPGLEGESVHFHPGGRRLAVVKDHIVQLRDLNGGGEVARFQHPGSVNTLAWRSDGKVFATGCADHTIYLWDVANPAQPLRTLKGHVRAVVGVGFSHGGDLLVSDSLDSTNRLWDPMTEQQLFSIPGGLCCQFGPDDRELDHGWQVATGRECRTFHGPTELRWVAISPGGRLMASGGVGDVRLWDLAATREGDKELATLPVGPCPRAQFDPKGESLITDGSAGLQRWPITPDPETGGLRVGPPQSLGLSARAPLLFPGYDPDFTLSANGRTVAHSPQRGQVLLFDPENSGRKLVLESPSLCFPAFSPDGRWLATGNWQGRGVKVWDARTGKPARDLDLGSSEEGTAWPAFSPDSKWLVTGTFAEYRFWEVGSWQEKKEPLPRGNAAKGLGWIVFSPDGKMLAVRHSMNEVRLVDPTTGRPFARLPTAWGPYGFSPDGSQLVTSSGRDGAFQVWDLRLIRRELKEMDLDWDLPPYPPPSPERAGPLRVKVLSPEPISPSKHLDAEAYFERGLLLVGLRQSPWPDIDRARALDPDVLCWDKVLRAASQVIERDPADARAHHLRAHMHEWLGEWEQAAADHSRAIELAPEKRDYLVCRGRAYLRTGQPDKAEEDFQNVGEQKPDEANSLAFEVVASPNPLAPERRLALALARQATRQAPGEALYWSTLGAAYYWEGEWEAALQALDEAEKRAPGKHVGFNAYFRALCQEQLGDSAKARDSYDRAVRWYEENQGKVALPATDRS